MKSKQLLKPQLLRRLFSSMIRCIILLFYIKPQLHVQASSVHVGCIILLFYIKPQLNNVLYIYCVVV